MLQDKYGRAVIRTEDGDTARYDVTLSDGAFSISFPKTTPLEQVMETIEAMAPEAPAAPPEIVVPEMVAMWQLRVALDRRGKLTAASQLAAGVGGVAQEAWEYAATVERSSTLLNALAPQLGLSQSDVDAIFVEAATVEA